jgi:hypothetical protein
LEHSDLEFVSHFVLRISDFPDKLKRIKPKNYSDTACPLKEKKMKIVTFPGPEHSFKMPEETLVQLKKMIGD